MPNKNMNGISRKDSNGIVHFFKTVKPLASNEWYLPDTVLEKIVANLSIKEWPKLMLISRQFYNVTLMAYKCLKNLHIYDLFPLPDSRFLPDSRRYPEANTVTCFNRLSKVLYKLCVLCPNLHKLSGFDCVTEVVFVTEINFEQLLSLKRLTSVRFKRCCFSLEKFALFLNKSQNLSELQLEHCTWKDSLKYVNNQDYFLESFQCVIGLKSLMLRDFKEFSGSFFQFINTKSLENLDLLNSWFQANYVSDFLSRCVGLKSLSLFNPILQLLSNSIRVDKLIRELPGLHNLENLTLQFNCYYTSGLDDCIGRCINLRKLSIIDNNHSIIAGDDRLIETIFRNCHFQTLSLLLTSYQLNMIRKENLHNLRELQSLSILRCNLGYGINSFRPMLKNIKSLHVDVSSCNHDDFIALTKLENLKELYITDTTLDLSISNDVVECWQRSKFINRMSGFGLKVSQISTSALAYVVENGENLRELKLKLKHGEITDRMVSLIADRCKRLEYLAIFSQASMQISVQPFLKLLNSCNFLKELNVNESLLKRLLSCQQFRRFSYNVNFGSTLNWNLSY